VTNVINEDERWQLTLGFQPVQTAAAPLSWQALLVTQRRMSMAETAAARLTMRPEVFMFSEKDGLS
jgi:hypothetical protein